MILCIVESFCRFFNRGKITGIRPGNTAGEVTVSKDRKAIEWDIGTKFTAKNLEVALPSDIFFGKRDFSYENKEGGGSGDGGDGGGGGGGGGGGAEERRKIVGRIDDDEEEDDDEGSGVDGSNVEDPFCTGANCYAKVAFKIQQFGHIEIPSKNMSLIPKGKTQANFLSERFFQSGEYVIWNSWGNVNYAAKFPQR